MTSSDSQNAVVSFVPRVVLVCWLVFLALTAASGAVMDHYWASAVWVPLRWMVYTIIISFLSALMGLATIIGGLAGRSWVVSWMGAVLLSCIHTVVMISGAAAAKFLVGVYDFAQSDHWLTCTFLPALLLATCAPLLLMRVVFGWTLVRRADPAIPRLPLSLEDLMSVGIVIASSMTLAQVMMTAEGPGPGQLLLTMVLFAGVSLLCIPITVYVSFRVEPLWRRLMGWLVLSCMATIVIYGTAAVAEQSWSAPLRNLIYFCVGVPVGCLTIVTGILALRASGYQLTYFEAKGRGVEQSSAADVEIPARDSASSEPAQASDSWLDDSKAKSTSKGFRLDTKWQARLATAMIVIAAAAGGISVQLNHQRLVAFYRQFVDPKILGVRLDNHKLYGLAIGPDFEDRDLDRYLKHAGDLTELSLSGSKVTDAVLPKLAGFRLVNKLDLSRTGITTEGLLRWDPFSERQWPHRQFDMLSLADTKVNWSQLAEAQWLQRVQNIDLSGLNITDEQLAQPITARGLRLARNPITDAGVQSLLENVEVHHLDLTDTNIDGSTLATDKCPEDLVLDGTQITDATLQAILATGRVRKLSIARTKVTPAILKQLGPTVSLRLGAGLITEADLAKATPLSLEELWLNDQQFTGACLKTGGLTVRRLNLSGSSVTEDTLRVFVGAVWLERLGLAGTQISDGILPMLTTANVDLRHTKVTAEGLKNRPKFGFVTVSIRQFTAEEITELSRHGIRFDDNLFSDAFSIFHEDLW